MKHSKRVNFRYNAKKKESDMDNLFANLAFYIAMHLLLIFSFVFSLLF